MDNQQYSKATFDEIVFENRNKSYGAFIIRKLYNKNIFIALGISSFAFGLLLYIPLIIQKNSKVEIVEELKNDDTITIIDVPIDPRTPPPPPMPELEIPKIKTVKFVPLEVAKVDEEVREPDPKTQKELAETTASSKDQEGVNDTTGTTVTNNQKGALGGMEGGTEEEQIYFGAVTKKAEPPGGMAGLSSYVNTHISQMLHQIIIDNEITGTMYVVVTIGSDGKVVEATLYKGMKDCKKCDSEIPQIISGMPNWTPGESNGHKVRLKFSIPIRF